MLYQRSVVRVSERADHPWQHALDRKSDQGETIFFPEREPGELQPISLFGRVSIDDISGLVGYLADMLEV